MKALKSITFILFAGAASADVTITDTDFHDANWTAQKTADNTPGESGTFSGSQSLSIGTSAPSRRMTLNFTADGSSSQGIVVLHTKVDAVYDPFLQGRIEGLDFSVDKIDDGNGQFAFTQGGRIYLVNSSFSGGSTWSTSSVEDMQPVDFECFYCPVYIPPDFSMSGQPLTFGLSNGGSTGGSGSRSRQAWFDNFQVVVRRAPEVIFLDTEFSDSSWSAEKVGDTTPGQDATFSGAQSNLNGVSVPSRRMTLSFVADGSSSQGVSVLHKKLDAFYNPASQGGIVAIDFSVDKLDDGNGQFAFVQDDQLYLVNSSFTGGSSWSNASEKNLAPEDFECFQCVSYRPPDFSTTAAPLTFGIWNVGSTSEPGARFREAWFDNFRVAVHFAPATAPVANAGIDQRVIAGALVQLDGSASFDDNTPTSALAYSWELTSKPLASAAVLASSSSATPSFVADSPGTYIATLIVSDQNGEVSAPDYVVLSSDNLPPIASINGPDLVVVGDLVTLDSAGTADPEGDPIQLAWVLASRPAGSSANLSSIATPLTNFVPDVAGDYSVNLVASDPLGSGVAETHTTSAMTGDAFAEQQILNANLAISALDPAAGEVTTGGNQNALQNFLQQAISRIQSGKLFMAIGKLQSAITRSDGCIVNDEPDGPGRDWVLDCDIQEEIYASLAAAVAEFEILAAAQ